MDIKRGENVTGSIDGTIQGGASLVPGKHGSALSLNGIDGRVYYGMHLNECFHLPEMCTTGSTFAYWLRYRTPNNEAVILDSGGMYLYSHGYTVRIDNTSELHVQVNDASTYYDTIAYLYGPDNWLFIVHTWSPSSGINIYLNGCIMNGQGKAKGPRTNNVTESFPFMIGEAVADNPLRADMDLDNLMAWDDELTPDEIWQLYVQAGNMPTPW